MCQMACAALLLIGNELFFYGFHLAFNIGPLIKPDLALENPLPVFGQTGSFEKLLNCLALPDY